jgi:glutamate-ammonia-ligase adenylyltransferase
MDALRHFKHSQTFRLLAQDLEGMLPVTKLSDHLSKLADIILDRVLATVWPQLAPGAPTPPFTLIAYGRLGGKELGYASDLDLIFLYDDPNDEAAALYVRLAQRLIAWLNTGTGAGKLYEVDVRLRPDGESGLLISRFDAFCRYQREHAWVWEHQALTRARFCAGNRDLGTRFEAERETILRLPRDLATLRREELAMRKRMHDAHPPAPGLFDLKHDTGGMIDIEFIVQYLVLGHSHRQPEMTGNMGNIKLLAIGGGLGLIDEVLSSVTAEAYRRYRLRQHALRLSGMEHARVPEQSYGQERAAVGTLWHTVFGDEA